MVDSIMSIPGGPKSDFLAANIFVSMVDSKPCILAVPNRSSLLTCMVSIIPVGSRSDLLAVDIFTFTDKQINEFNYYNNSNENLENPYI